MVYRIVNMETSTFINRSAIFACFCLVVMVTSSLGGPIEVVWMVPFKTPTATTSNFEFNASSSVAALALGLETIKNQSLLPAFDLNVTMIDTKCNSKQSLGALVELLFVQNVDVVIGPPCAEVVQTVGELLSYIDTPLMNWVSTGQTIDRKTALSTYIRTMAPISSLGGIMILFYYYTGWKRFIVISSDGDDYSACANTVITHITDQAANNFTVAHHYSEVKINVSTGVIDEMLSFIIHEGRIIILIIPRDELRKYMLRAHALGMTGGDYQFLYTEANLADQKDEQIINSDVLWRQGDQYDDSARQAFENVLYFLLGHNMRPVSEWRNASFGAFGRIFQGRADVPTPTEPDEFSAYLHDTIILYARIMNQSLTQHYTGSGTDLFLWTSIEYFRGLSGDVVMNGLADRQPTFYVYDLNAAGIFQQVASLRYTIDPVSNQKNVSNSFTTIRWGDGSTTENDYTPPDTPPCGFFNEKCPESDSKQQSYEVLIISLSVGMLIILLVLYMVYRWWRGEHDLKNMTWKINPADLNFSLSKKGQASFVSGRSMTQSSTGSSSSVTLQGTMRSGALSIRSTRRSITRGQIFTTIALYRGEVVAVKMSKKKKLTLDRAFLLQMKHLVELKHGNLTNFIGVCTAPEKICSVWEYCNKGSIQDVIENDDILLDTMFKLSLAADICQGLDYIHKSPIKFHGNLRSSNCVIDSRWICRLTDHGLQQLKSPQEQTEESVGEHAFFARLFWTAPEILRKLLKKQPYEGTQQGDIYALGVIIKELVCRNEPYCDSQTMTPKEIITRVAYPDSEDKLFRPLISDTELDTEYRRRNMEYLIERCWAEDVERRPPIKTVLRTLNKINPYKKSSVVDNMIAMMEKYSNNLEEVVAERTVQLQEEKRKTDALLYRMLPKKVADDLKFGRSVQAEAFDFVTIYFSDIVQFTILASESTPLEIVALLNGLYTVFDDIVSNYDVYKVETIGDAYMIVSGLPERNGNLHVREIGCVALDILQSVLTFKIPHKPDRQLQIRIGLHTGPAVAGVVGLTMPRYCLFGDTVNTASRMESNGKPLKIHMSYSTKHALEAFPNFIVEDRGEIPIKGKGLMTTYWLAGMYNSEEDICLDSNEFKKLTEPDRNTLDGSISSPRDGAETIVSGLKVFKVTEGKISVADSGICMDKGIDDRDAVKSDIESEKEQPILNSRSKMGSDEEYNVGENNAEHISDNDILFVRQNTPIRSNSCTSINKHFDSDEHCEVNVQTSKRKNSHSYPRIEDSRDTIPTAVLGLVDQITTEKNKSAKRSETASGEMPGKKHKNKLLGKKDKKIKQGKKKSIADKEPTYVGISNPLDLQHRYFEETDTSAGGQADTLPTDKRLLPLRHSCIDFMSSSENEADDDIFPNNVTGGTSIFQVPARRSATDFMSVQNNWTEPSNNNNGENNESVS